MENKKVIATLDDVKVLVSSFYTKVKLDQILAPIFDHAIGNKWPEHIEKMNRFWNTVLLGNHVYFGSPFPKHIPLPINETHFTRWLFLFNDTIDERFTGNKADDAKLKSFKMAELFESKLRLSRENHKLIAC